MSDPRARSLPSDDNGPSSTAIFMVLRRMRAPLLVLIVTFAVSVFGLTLVPGVTPQGEPWRMDVFDAFYFMSYTASTIGYGEIPYPFTTGQRMWVTISIYLTVIAWAYAIGTVFALLGDKGFKTALTTQRFARVVRHLREPFQLMVGFGQAGELLARSLDSMDKRLVTLDIDQERIDALELAAFHNDVPGHVGDGRNPEELIRAGLMNPYCNGVIALTDDDEANLAVVMAAALLRPELPVVARTTSHAIATRMADFGSPQIIDPFDLFGDELLLDVTAPDTARLVEWLTAGPGDHLAPRPTVPARGRWIVCGYGRFGSRLTQDLLQHDVDVTVIDPQDITDPRVRHIQGDATDPRVLAQAGLSEAVAFAAATDNDTTNLSLTVAARQTDADLFLVARQNQPVNAPLFTALDIDAVLVPTRLVAHEVTARIGDPTLWRFIQAARQRPDDWSRALLERLERGCGDIRPDLWEPVLDGLDNPPLVAWLAGDAQLGDLLHDPDDRSRELDCVVLLLQRDDDTILAPGPDTTLRQGDHLLIAGTASARRALDNILSVPEVFAYVTSGQRVGNSWLRRTMANRH